VREDVGHELADVAGELQVSLPAPSEGLFVLRILLRIWRTRRG
jgi:hypothetical protein